MRALDEIKGPCTQRILQAVAEPQDAQATPAYAPGSQLYILQEVPLISPQRVSSEAEKVRQIGTSNGVGGPQFDTQKISVGTPRQRCQIHFQLRGRINRLRTVRCMKN